MAWNRILSRRRLLQASAAALASASLRPLPAAEEGFEPLFNGKDLTGWEGDPLLWIVEDEMIVGRSPGIQYNDFLVSEGSYQDFILRFSVHLLNNDGNSGVQFRSQRVPGSMEMIGYQADAGPSWWGNLYDESRRRKSLVEADPKVLKRVLKPDGWNEYEIYAKGPQIRLKINGGTTAEYEETDPAIPQEGHFGLQVHSGPPLEVRFKNIRLQKL